MTRPHDDRDRRRDRPPPGVRVTDIRWDAGLGAYHGMVAFSGPAGLSMLRVSAPGRPGWDHDRVSAALAAAGRARGGDLAVHSDAGPGGSPA